MNTIDATNSTSTDKSLLTRAIKNFDACVTASAEQRIDSLDDLKFLHGEQWDEKVVQQRKADGRPALTVNRLLAFKNQVVNDGLQNRPSIKVRPVDDLTDPKTAEIINGIVRHILNNGDSKTALDTAYDSAVSCGFGYFRVCTDFVNDNSFDQDIYIERIENPFSVYVPFHLCKRADYSDAPHMFIRVRMSKSEFTAKYPNVDISNFEKGSTGDNAWIDDDNVFLAEYFEVEEKEKQIYLLENNMIVERLPEGVKPKKSRTAMVKTWYRYLLTDGAILEEKQEWPSKYPPIIPVLGQEFCIEGKKSYSSITRFAKDPQTMHNYWLTAFTEQVGMQPRVPWLVAEGQIAGYENIWKSANVKNVGYLPYKVVSANGTPIAPPKRVEPPAVGSAIIQGVQMSSESLKEVTGIFDASLGAAGNESSGRAILARQRQGDTSNFHYVNNFNRAVRQLGRLLIDLIPKIYDAPRTIRILGEDMTDSVVMINQMHQDEKTGEPVLYDVTVGNYDVVSDVGPAFETKRLEAADSIQNLISAVPTIGAVCADLLVRYLDFPGADELANRLKKTLPPNLLEDDKNNGKIDENEVRQIVDDLQKLQQQLQASGDENAQLKQMLGQMQALLNDKSEERQVKMDTAVLRADTELKKASMQLHHDAAGRVLDTAMQLHAAPDNAVVRNQPVAAPGQFPESLQ